MTLTSIISKFSVHYKIVPKEQGSIMRFLVGESEIPTEIEKNCMNLAIVYKLIVLKVVEKCRRPIELLSWN